MSIEIIHERSQHLDKSLKGYTCKDCRSVMLIGTDGYTVDASTEYVHQEAGWRVVHFMVFNCPVCKNHQRVQDRDCVLLVDSDGKVQG
jgi:RNase P subunit RPR2